MSARATTNINIRASESTRTLIDRAARVLGRNRSEFVLEVVQERAREVLLDQTRFELTAAQHKRFIQILDEPLPKESQAALKRLLTRKPPWEK
jgi:uncharacterized protein (DUF1778 family)